MFKNQRSETATIMLSALSMAVGCYPGTAALADSISTSFIGMILGDELAVENNRKEELKKKLMEKH